MVSNERDADNMTDTLVTLSIYLLCMLCFLQPTLSRAVVAGVFVFFIMSHEVLAYSLDGLMYYGSSSLFDLLIISIITKISFASRLCFQLQLICLASIFINALGWMMWFTYQPPDLYNWCFIVLNFYAVYCLITGEPKHGRVATDDGGFPFLSGYFNSSRKPYIGL